MATVILVQFTVLCGSIFVLKLIILIIPTRNFEIPLTVRFFRIYPLHNFFIYYFLVIVHYLYFGVIVLLIMDRFSY